MLVRVSDPADEVSIPDVVDLINECSDLTREMAGEAADAYPEPMMAIARAARTAALVSAANNLHSVFADPGQAIDLLNAMADTTGVIHRLGPGGQLRWIRPIGSERVMCASLACLINLVDMHGPQVLGVCAADGCVDVYVDMSQAHSREYCSARCNNKARASRWRARHKSPSRQNR